MEELLLGYDTASTLAADALFGGSGDQQEHGKDKKKKKKKAQENAQFLCFTLVVELVNRG